MRRGRRPARYCTTKLLRPLGITRTPKPGMLSSQMKNSTNCGSVASMVRLVSLGMVILRNVGGWPYSGDLLRTVNEHIEIAK
jgi:hypothetical protein